MGWLGSAGTGAQILVRRYAAREIPLLIQCQLGYCMHMGGKGCAGSQVLHDSSFTAASSVWCLQHTTWSEAAGAPVCSTR